MCSQMNYLRSLVEQGTEFALENCFEGPVSGLHGPVIDCAVGKNLVEATASRINCESEAVQSDSCTINTNYSPNRRHHEEI